MATREQILADNPLVKEMESDGVKFITRGAYLSCKCPFHDDKNPSMSVEPVKQVFNCHGCGAAGSVIDYVALRDNISPGDAMKKLSGDSPRPRFTPPPKLAQPHAEELPEIETTYSYRDALGKELYQVVRMRPKDFRQRHQVDGKWVWNMQGVERVLYNLPLILKSNAQFVWVVEGEKDADNLKKLGFVATCNVGGAGKWLAGYSESLTGKEVILCGDNDPPGQAHMAMICDALAKKAKTVRLVKIPEPHKDVSDFIATFGEDKEAAAKTLYEMFEAATVLTGGVVVPVQTMAELEADYVRFSRDVKTSSLDLSCWIPWFSGKVRCLVPGEVVTILAATGVGKTAVLQNIAIAARPIPVLLFELELPGTLTFERFVSVATGNNGYQIENAYRAGTAIDWKTEGKLNHVCTCSKSSLLPNEIEQIILQTELKTGTRPKIAMLDYHQLVLGLGGTRYERSSFVAEQIKVVAKNTGTIIIVSSQVSRKSDGDGPEIFLNDGKDSGSVENSSGLVLGVWRDAENAAIMHLKILKNTKGKSGDEILCDFDGPTLQITQRGLSKIDPEDVPKPHND